MKLDLDALKHRNSSMDIIRIVALFTVISIHFFLHTGFYSQSYTGFYGPIESIVKAISEHNKDNLNGLWMFIMFMMRTLFNVCVPLFIILTGYLMSKKTLSRSYYKGIRKTVIIFVLVSIVHFFFKAFREDPTVLSAVQSGAGFGEIMKAFGESPNLDFKHFLLGIFDYHHANYSWYIEMYIGLFLIIPFLNLAYNNLKTRRQKQVLVLTFLLLTVLPTMFNIFNFDTAAWWLDPRSNNAYQKILPAFWMGMYPITYYYIGMYLREYGLKPKTKSLFGIFGISLLLATLFNVFRSIGGGFDTNCYNFWYGFIPCILSVILFELLRRIKSDNWNTELKFTLWKISDLVLGAYLMSYVSDMLIYDVLNKKVLTVFERFPYYFIAVPLSFLMSLFFSFILNWIYRGIIWVYERIKAFVIKQRSMNCGLYRQDILFIVFFGIILILLVWKCKYGFGGSDETFYLTVPHRLLKGDALFTDEWHLSQMSGFLLMPFVWIYQTLFGGTEEILLGARFFYIIIHSLAAGLIYTRVRKYGYISMIGVLLYYLFTPYSIMALCYNSMGLGLVTLTGVLLATAAYDKKLCIILSGMAYAAAVLCCPYLLSGYVLYALCVPVHLMLKKKETKFVLKSKMFAPRTFLWFTVGAGIVAVVFFAFLLSRTPISDVFKNLPYMLKDPEHQNISFGTKFGAYFKSIFKCCGLFKYFVYAYGVTLIAMAIDRKRKRHSSIYLMISIALTVLTQICFLPELGTKSYNYIMFPMIFITVTSYILCDKKPRELFVSLFCLGVLYSLCIHITSNQYFYIISVALTASNLAGFVFLSQLVREMREQPDDIAYALWMKRSCFVLIALAFIIQFCAQCYVKTHHVFWDSEPKQLQAEIKDGPAKGIKTTEANRDNYYQIYNDLQGYQGNPPDNILFMTMTLYPYLAVDYPYGTYSAWLSGENDYTLMRLREFYQLNPDKIPKYIYLLKSSGFNADTVLNEAQKNGYTVYETPVSYQLEKSAD